MRKVLIVEDQQMICEAMKSYIEKLDGYEVVAVFSHASAAAEYCQKREVNLVLMDVCTKGEVSGFEAARRIKEKKSQTKVIIVTSMIDGAFLHKAKKAGADSLWYKDASDSELTEVIKQTMAGNAVYPDKSPEIIIGNARSCEFTRGELRVLRLLVEGKTYKEMALELGISQDTVKEHVSNMLSKTGYKSKLRLATEVIAKKLIVLERV